MSTLSRTVVWVTRPFRQNPIPDVTKLKGFMSAVWWQTFVDKQVCATHACTIPRLTTTYREQSTPQMSGPGMHA